MIIWKDGHVNKFWNLLSGYELSDTITKFVEIIKIETFGYSTYWSKSSTSVPGDKDLQHLTSKKSLRNAHFDLLHVASFFIIKVQNWRFIIC